MIPITDKIIDGAILQKAIDRYREKGIILPTFAQMQNPELVPEKIQKKLQSIGLWELHPLNLFRLTWKNEPKETGGQFGKPNYFPSHLRELMHAS
jgi:cysteine synthase